MSLFQDAFAPLLGLPSWDVHKVHGSIVTMQFGPPTLDVGEARPGPVFLEGVPERLMRRSAYVRGDWCLTIDCCVWTLRSDDAELAHSESDDTRMARAFAVLNGQSLIDVEVQTDGSTTFAFDLGCTLVTSPAATGVYEDTASLWTLLEPSGDGLTVRADGAVAKDPGHTPPDRRRWVPISTLDVRA